MREKLLRSSDGSTIEGKATYARFRRYQVDGGETSEVDQGLGGWGLGLG